jgi:hypothetical protein
MPPSDSVAPSPGTSPVAPAAARWSDAAWLDSLRQMGDPRADACAKAMKAAGVPSSVTRGIIARLKQNDQHFPEDAPQPLKDFFADTYSFCKTCGSPELPRWVDRNRIIRGQQAFMERSVPSILVMLCKSLPEGYAAPSMAKILNLSGDLTKRPYHRLMGTLQLLLDVSSPYSFERLGIARMAGQEMRLLHAGVRSNVAPEVLGDAGYDAFVAQYGVPINQEDMAGTIIGFSLLVVDGLATLGLGFDDQAAEDYYYVWRVFAHRMGLRYPGSGDEIDCMPQTLAEARAFYAVYQRHYVGPTDYSEGWRERAVAANPDGVALTDAHVLMLGRFVALQDDEARAGNADETDATGFLGRFVENAGIHAATKYVHMLIGEAGCARIGLANEDGNLFGDFLAKLPVWWEGAWSHLDPKVHIAASEWLFGKLVTNTYRNSVVFPVPLTVKDLNDLAIRGD